MSENQKEKEVRSTESAADSQGDLKGDLKKAGFGSLTPLTTAQIITLLVGTTSSNSSYGGY